MEQEIVEETSVLISIFKDYAIPFFALTISIIALIVSWNYNKKTSKRQVLKEILDEYRSEKMGAYMVDIWNFYRKGPKTLVERYVKEYKINGYEKESIHIKRRYVSQYFQQVALYYYENFVSKKDLKRFWGKSSIIIIDEILRPIEIEAIGEIINELEINVRIKMMFQLYDELISKNE